jgi:hypothetical protein
VSPAFAAVFAGAFFAAAFTGTAGSAGTVALARGAREPAATVFAFFEVLAAAASGAGWSAGTQVPSRAGLVPRGTV